MARGGRGVGEGGGGGGVGRRAGAHVGAIGYAWEGDDADVAWEVSGWVVGMEESYIACWICCMCLRRML